MFYDRTLSLPWRGRGFLGEVVWEKGSLEIKNTICLKCLNIIKLSCCT